MYDHFWLFLAISGYFGTIKHLKRRKYTNCNYLGAKSSKKYMKMASYSDLEIWSQLGQKPTLIPKMALKWQREAKIGPNAPHVV